MVCASTKPNDRQAARSRSGQNCFMALIPIPERLLQGVLKTHMITTDIFEGLTFDDVLLVPDRSDVLPYETDAATQFTRNIRLQIPLCSAAMDTVTEASLAIALAQQGGIGVVHKNLSIERQAEEVDKVKRSESGMIVDPV